MFSEQWNNEWNYLFNFWTSDQETSLIPPSPHHHIYLEDFKMVLRNRKWKYLNRKWNFEILKMELSKQKIFSYFLTVDKKHNFQSFLSWPVDWNDLKRFVEPSFGAEVIFCSKMLRPFDNMVHTSFILSKTTTVTVCLINA